MTTAWILYMLLVGLLLALGARAVATALSLGARGTRWAWALALAGLVVLAVVAPRERSITVIATTNISAAQVEPSVRAGPRRDLFAMTTAARDMIGTAAIRAVASADVRIPRAIEAPILITWVTTSVVLLAIYLIVNVRLSRARRGWPRERLHGIPVRIAPAAGPAVIGMVRAEIVVPRSLLQRSFDEQQLILTHENEHLRARDHLLLGLACLVAIVLPWHPAVWYLLARLRLAIELDCDARVLRRGAAPRSYGALLIDMAAHGPGIRVGTLALADRPSHLERRLLAMKTNRPRFVLARGGALCAVATLLVLGACEAKIPTAAEISTMDVTSAEKSASNSGLFSQSKFENADFFVNGLSVTRQAAHAIDGARIGSIEVVKGGRDTVIVTTVDRMPIGDSLPMKAKIRTAGTPMELPDGPIMLKTPMGNPTNRPTIMIDGAMATEAALAAIPTSEIASINVVKPMADAVETRHPNGLVMITTKMRASRGADRPRVIEVPSKTQSKTVLGPSGFNIRLREMPAWTEHAMPAFTIDGERASREEFNRLDQSKVTAIDVVKGNEATAISADPAAANGLVKVTTVNAGKN